MSKPLATLLVIALISACTQSAPQRPAIKCRAGSTENGVLLAEWSNIERAELERKLGEGAIAVAYSGCEMQIVPCRLGGQYGWQRISNTSTERIEVTSLLSMTATIAGYARLTGMDASMVPAECTGATHLIDTVSVGAFALTSTERGSPEQLRAAGDPAACSQATDEAPADGCNATIQVALAPIPGRVEKAPPGSVRTSFSSELADKRWDVIVNDKAICTTPCTRMVDPTRPILMRMREREHIEKAQLSSLPTDQGPLAITARAIGSRQANGFMVAFLGGFMTLTGLMLAVAGGGKDDGGGYIVAGVITGAVSIPILVLGIAMFRTKPKLFVVPLYDRGGPTKAMLGPTGIVGSF